MIWGIDISHYQGNFDLGRARREGFDFAILKATEGHTYTDPWFSRNLAKARDAGLLVAAYHYQREESAAQWQADHIEATVPKGVPVILDVEHGGGGVALTRQLNAELNRRGYRTPLLYLPAWYWRQIGSPDLSGLPPLWYSRYANYEGGAASAIYQRNADWFAQHWDGYGGLPVAVLQFTSSATVAGHTPVDGNAYRGTRQELAAMFDADPGTVPEEDDLQFDDTYTDWDGNTQSFKGTLDRFDRKLWAIENALLNAEPSRVPGAEHINVPLTDAVRDTNGVVYQLPGLIRANEKLMELLADKHQLDVGQIKQAVSEALAEGTVNVEVSVTGQPEGGKA